MGATRFPRGAAGGKRDMREKKHLGKVRARQMNVRVQGALDAARRAREALDARMTAEAAQPVLGGPVYRPPAGFKMAGTFVVPEETRVDRPLGPPQPTAEQFITQVEALIPEMAERFRSIAEADPGRWQAGTGRWTLQQAVDMLEDGYQLQQVVRKTGWGAGWFEEFQFEGGYLAG